MNLKKIDDIDDFSQLGFHFSDGSEKINNIEKNGLKPLIGDNSATFEATPKISFSLGLNGLFQTANRFLNLAQTMPISFFLNDTHIKYLPNNIDSNYSERTLSTLEALEFMKNYFGNSSYFVFDAPASEYENEVTNDNLNKANENIKDVCDLVPINDNGEILDINYNELNGTYNFSTRMPTQNETPKNLISEVKKIKSCLEKNYLNIGKANLTPQQLQEYELLVNAKNKSIIRIMELTSLDLQRGKLLEDGLFDSVSFHEEKLKWRKQSDVNTQSRVIINNNKAIGKGVEPEDLFILSVDGLNKANNLEVLSSLYSKINENDVVLAEDIDMVGLLLEYSNIPENGIEQYIATHPNFGYKIISAQNHAKSKIEKQHQYLAKSSEKKQQVIPSEPMPKKHTDVDYGNR